MTTEQPSTSANMPHQRHAPSADGRRLTQESPNGRAPIDADMDEDAWRAMAAASSSRCSA
ncbi:hypothetical protein [Amycolatopsis kentuckyensis]|uniref:hypothetical protein n=1 Tax=Amycolatopsis kentuckyensis TaxID=218823 RepID=UPI00356A98C9